ncbi:MAG: glycerol kinase GlpK [Gemmataceae bacterium]|nr:glycerol kinase GlpK [Gemmataceae bacterium]MCI0740196.1 glycerol kinase GlpK [Gemmataceae bacterium]
MENHFILAIDQGTTSTRAVVFDEHGQERGSASQEFKQHYPQPGWVEHDAAEIWQTVAQVVPKALATARIEAKQIAGLGITNQRETVVLWDRKSGQPVARAIVWQDRRTADFCRSRRADEAWLSERTGLVLDPYFSATKIRWLLEQDADVRRRAERGDLAAGTIDSWLIWNLTGGKVHATDYSNASRTLLLNLQTAAWDSELCQFFGVPEALLPVAIPSAGDFGATTGLSFLPDGLPIRGVAGDQQAALFGNGGFTAGQAKCTYGTGAFFLQHTGNHLVRSRHRLLTSLAAAGGQGSGGRGQKSGVRSQESGVGGEGLQYVIEGSVFIAGAAVQWLRDGLRFISTSADVEKLAALSDPQQPVIFVPGFVGLGAPHWVPEARGVVFGLTRNTTAADLARAALEGVALQVADLVDAAGKDTGLTLADLRVDGGMARNAWFLQCQADILGMPVVASTQTEATALGAAFLAGLGVQFWPSLEALGKLTQAGRRFEPQLPQAERASRRAQWQRAVRAVIDFYAGN